MNWRDMPPLAALRAFAAFAESGTLEQAGDALNVTHAAISQHIRALETHLGVALVFRSGRSLELTAEGQQLAQVLTAGFGTILNVVQELTGRDAARPLHISTTPSFAASWLMPRLSDFRLSHPDINLMIDPSPVLSELRPGGIDVAIRYGSGRWPGVDAQLLLSTHIVVSAAPALLEGREITDPRDLAELPWLEELGTSEANNWLRDRGVPEGLATKRVQIPGNLVLDGARAGQGLAVTAKTFIEADVAAGRLVILFEEPREGEGYHIVTRPGVLRASARDFVSWLRRAARQM